MSKFNQGPIAEKNLAGGPSYKRTSAEAELASVILNSMLKSDSYYESDSARIKRIVDIAKNLNDKTFLAKAMIYARTEGNLRSVSHILANILADVASGEGYVRRAIYKAIVRPDDMTEMFAYRKNNYSGMIPNSMRRAFKDALESKFVHYQLCKYAQPRAKVKLKDIIKIAHPKRDLCYILNDKFSISTIERKLSSGENAGKAVEGLLNENKLGYMAALKNIRNALNSGISNEGLNKWVELISDKRRLRNSKVLPFRFIDAWNSVKDLDIDKMHRLVIKRTLENALEYSAKNIELFPKGERVAIAVDCSGSMTGGSNYWKTAATLASSLYKALDNVVLYTFDNKLTFVDNISSVFDFVNNYNFGGATYLHLPLLDLIRSQTVVDTVFIFTDMQMYTPYNYKDNLSCYWSKYKKIAPKAKLIFWNVAGYPDGTPISLNENDIYELCGFSDKMLSIIPKFIEDKNALVNDIKKIDLN